MNKIVRILTTVVLVFIGSGPLFAQWVHTNGPYGGNISAIVVSGGNIFASALDAGVYRSTDSGLSWVSADSGMQFGYGGYVVCLAATGGRVFAGTSGNGVYCSTDNGNSWFQVAFGLTNMVINCLVSSNSGLFAGTQGGVFVSTDNGASWTGISAGLTNMNVNTIAASDSFLFAGTVSGLFRSTDDGASWTVVSSGPTRNNVRSVVVSGSVILAGTGGGIFRSTDNGASWTPSNSGLASIDVRALAVLPNREGTTNIYAGSAGGGICHSTDNGATWILVNSELSPLTSVFSLATADSVIYAGTDDGVYKSSDDGLDWTWASSEIQHTIVTSLVASRANIFSGTFTAGVFRSTDGGTSWIHVNEGLTCLIIRSLYVSDTAVFAGTEQGLFVSTNAGANWSHVGPYLPGPIWSIAVSGKNLVVGSGLSEFYSSDNGARWGQGLGMPTNSIVASMVTIGTNVFACSSGNGVYRSVDNGVSWNVTTSGIPNIDASSLAIVDSCLFVGNAKGGIYLSTDNGESWKEADSGLSDMALYINCLLVDGKNIFAATDAGVFLSTNYGVSWGKTRSGQMDAIPTSLAVNDTNIFAGTVDQGLWRQSIWEMIPPSVPAPVFPGHGATNLPSKLTLKCSSTQGAYGYRWQASTDSGFYSPLVDSSTNSRTDTTQSVTLAAGTKYYWRVQAFNAGGASAFSEPDSFTVMSAPSTPVPISPVNNARNLRADTVVFEWHGVSSDTGYVCQVSTDQGFSSLAISADTTTDTVFHVTSLKNLQEYYWHVCSYNAGGESAFTSTDSFKTLVAIPNVPKLASPVATTGEPRRTTLIWDSSANAGTYHLQIASSNSIDSSGEFLESSLVFDTTMADTAERLAIPLSANTTYYWHVSAADAAGTSAYSAVASYKTGTGIDAVEESAAIPKTYALYQNYPNPFNPSTTINYDLPRSGHVTLDVYDALGRRVAVLVDEEMEAGRYSVSFDGSKLPSGVYFYSLNAGTYHDTRKLLLLK